MPSHRPHEHLAAHVVSSGCVMSGAASLGSRQGQVALRWSLVATVLVLPDGGHDFPDGIGVGAREARVVPLCQLLECRTCQPVGNCLVMLNDLLLNPLRLSEAQPLQQWAAGGSIDNDGEHSDATDMEHDLGAGVAVSAGIDIHDYRQDKTNRTSEAGPDHDDSLLPGNLGPDAVQDGQHAEDHDRPNCCQARVEDKEVGNVDPAQM
mmetsp:Transcript_77183/g.165444  ORF Transcript_77183/g.165444 Transcript_77183/m.165444 type:complete len:207 (-) Transcript_77183:1065-1685(-)